MGRTERLLAIVLLLQVRGKLTADGLAGLLDVSSRTIYRDMDALSLAHVPVSMDYGPGGGYFLAPGYRIDPASFTVPEALLLSIGATLADGAQLVDSDRLGLALTKLEACLPVEVRADVRAASRSVVLDPVPWHREGDVSPHLASVRSALWSRHRLDLWYRRPDRPAGEWRCVEPLGLVCKAGSWYLVAYCLSRADYRVFRLDRVQELAILDAPVQPHVDFDLRSYWEASRHRFERATAPIRLVLRLTPHAAYQMPERTELLRREQGGATVVAVGIDRPEAALAFALSLGADAEVLEPRSVRAAVREATVAMQKLYNRV